MKKQNEGRDLSRRMFLKLGGVGVAGVAFAPLLNGCESHTVTPLVAPERVPFITPRGAFFVQNGGQGSLPGWTQPSFASEQEWSLDILRGNTVLGTVTWDDLMRAADEGHAVNLLKTMQCVLESEVRTTATGLIGNAWWTGVPLKLFLDRFGLDYSPGTSIRRILLSGADLFYNNVRPERIARSEETGLAQPLLCYRMNGQPIPPEHGFPVRLIIEEGYGYKNVKWITEVQGVTFDGEFGTYQDEGFVDDGVMRVNSRGTSVYDEIALPEGEIEIRGFALSGYAPIARVEISIDGGSWEEAELVPIEEIQEEEGVPPQALREGESWPYRAVWTPWRRVWNASRGSHTIRVRAADADGNEQPLTDDDPFDGQNEVPTYRVRVG